MLEASMHQLHTSLDNESAATSSNTAEQGPGFEHTANATIFPTTSHNTDSTLRALLCGGPACGLEIEIEIVSEATIGAHSQYDRLSQLTTIAYDKTIVGSC
jgi:hypothetical protein